MKSDKKKKESGSFLGQSFLYRLGALEFSNVDMAAVLVFTYIQYCYYWTEVPLFLRGVLRYFVLVDPYVSIPTCVYVHYWYDC